MSRRASPVMPTVAEPGGALYLRPVHVKDHATGRNRRRSPPFPYVTAKQWDTGVATIRARTGGRF